MTGAYQPSPYGSADFKTERRKLPLCLFKRRCLIGTRDFRGTRTSRGSDRAGSRSSSHLTVWLGGVRNWVEINLHTCVRLLHEIVLPPRCQQALHFPAGAIVRQSCIHDCIDDDITDPRILLGRAPQLH